MKRFAYVGIAVVAILGIAITMALVSNPAAAEQFANDGAALIGNEAQDTADSAAPITDLTQDNGETAVLNNGSGVNFVDEDGDGVCDTCGSVPGTGTGNQYGNGNGVGSFVDEDGDGICDTCGTAPADGTGSHYGNGNGAENCVDADGDGLCDNTGTAPADGTGNQYGRQGGNSGQGGNGSRGQGRGGQRGASTP